MPEQSLWEPPEVEIAGEEYQLRRLGIKDLRGLWSVVRSTADQLDLSVFEEEGEEEELGKDFIMDILDVGPEAFQDVVEWLVGIVDGLDEEDIDNPETFPVHAPFTIIEALGEHEDYTKFFTKGRKAMTVLQKMSPASQTSSEQSATEKDGQTST